MRKKYTALVFDLDDTLFDTYNQITKKILPSTFRHLIDEGLDATEPDCWQFRKKHIATRSTENFFLALGRQFAPTEAAETFSELAQDEYFRLLSKLKLHVPPSTVRILEDLKYRHDLYLVTAGKERRQSDKVSALGLIHFFSQIFYVDSARGDRKKQAFAKIVNTLQSDPEEVLSVGNRIDLDIGEAKAVGLETCHIQHGEYLNLIPRSRDEEPDYKIQKLDELYHICQI